MGKLLLVGCGKMGGAMLDGWLARGLAAADVIVAEPVAVFLSIAAGKTLKYFASHLGSTAKVVRSMPNTPAAVRQGITVACASSGVSAAEKKRCQELQSEEH